MIINIENVVIANNSAFIGNRAITGGGAIYFSCDAGATKETCSLNITDTLFQNNHALVEGGALKWNVIEPFTQNVTWLNNTAGIYGNDTASVANAIIRIPSAAIDNGTTRFL